MNAALSSALKYSPLRISSLSASALRSRRVRVPRQNTSPPSLTIIVDSANHGLEISRQLLVGNFQYMSLE